MYLQVLAGILQTARLQNTRLHQSGMRLGPAVGDHAGDEDIHTLA